MRYINNTNFNLKYKTHNMILYMTVVEKGRMVGVEFFIMAAYCAPAKVEMVKVTRMSESDRICVREFYWLVDVVARFRVCVKV